MLDIFKFDVPVVNIGDQMTSVTHVGDVASMLVDAVGNQNASKEIFNVVSPRYFCRTFYLTELLAHKGACKRKMPCERSDSRFCTALGM